MSVFEYCLGTTDAIHPLFPSVRYIDRAVGLTSKVDVIRHFTESSLALDRIAFRGVAVRAEAGSYHVRIEHDGCDAQLEEFSHLQVEMLSERVGGKALRGEALLKQLGVWNPMEGYPVNESPADGLCKWSLFLPIGLGVSRQRAVTLLHYPPWQALQEASYLNNMTLQRWVRLLSQVGIPADELDRYKTILDVNPIAAPGSGQSEYANDYFPIMLSSAAFDGPGELDYIRSMLDLLLNPPYHDDPHNTLPLLVCGSPLYDPQAPGWFRVAFKDQMPKDAAGVPRADVLQTGYVRLRPDSPRRTPYLIANHMIAAGVTGKCTPDASRMPDMRLYEAQDLVAAQWLQQYGEDPGRDPAEAKRNACRRWFGAEGGACAPRPPEATDRETLCALAQMDLFFEPGPPPHPMYTLDEARARCRGAADDPCGAAVAPPPPKTTPCAGVD